MLLAALVRGWLVAHSVAAAQDGFQYIQMARAVAEGRGLAAIKSSLRQPLYPCWIAVVHGPVRCWAGHDGPETWQWAAQVAASIAAVLLVVPVYRVGRELFDPATALLGVLLFNLLPVPVRETADALSDSTHLLFATTALALGLAGLRRRSPGLWVLSGLAAGLAYLTRPEGLIIVVALIGGLLAAQLGRATRWPLPRWAAALGALIVATEALMLPYVVLRGRVTGKPVLAVMAGRTPASAPLAPAGGTEPEVERSDDEPGSWWHRQEQPVHRRGGGDRSFKTHLRGVRELVRQVAAGLHYVLVPPALLGLLGAGALRRRARRRPAPGGPAPGRWVVLLLAGLMAAAMVRVYAAAGYMASRHGLWLVLVGTLFAAAGLRAALGRRRVVLTVAVLIIAGLCLPRTLEPLHPTRWGHRQAARWITAHTSPDAVLLVTHRWSAFYSERRCYDHRRIAEAVRDPKLAYIVVEAAELRGTGWRYTPQIRALLGDRAPVAGFPLTAHGTTPGVLIFPYSPARSPAGAAGAET